MAGKLPSRGQVAVIGISGRTGSGKSTTAGFVAGLGFAPLSTREVLAEVLEVCGESVTRARLQKLGAEVHSTLGQQWLFDQVTDRISVPGRYVIDGLRFADDHAYLAQHFDTSFFHVHVEAPTRLRRRRFIERGGTEDEFDLAEDDVTESQSAEMRRLADAVVVNDASVGQLEASISDVVTRLKEGQ